MQIAHTLFAIALVMFGVGCANDDMPVRANYVPAECPTPAAAAEQGPSAEVAVPRDEPDEKSPETEKPKPPDEPAGARAAKVDKVDDGMVDINKASEMELTRLPGVGPALAARIVGYRTKRVFEKPEELLRVRGIGPAKFAKMKAMVTVADGS